MHWLGPVLMMLLCTLVLTGCPSPVLAPALGGGGGPAAARVEQAAPPPPAAWFIWPAPLDVGARIDAAGLARLPAEGDVLHLHVYLEVFLDGRQVVVPGDLGVDPRRRFISPIHTHYPTGVIHVESPEAKPFTLGQLFTLWDVPLTGARAVVDGRPVADPAAVVFRDYQLITVRFGEG
jgi:hypothetical protein